MTVRVPITQKINELFDYAVSHADGFTYVDIQNDLGWKRGEFFKVVNRCRSVLAGDTINLIAETQGQRGPWLYRLVGNVEDASWWAANRLDDAEQRLTTIRNVAMSAVKATDGRTNAGRRARIIFKSLTRLLEDLGDLHVADGTSA